MSDAPGFQVTQNQPVEISVTGLPGGPALRLHAATSQTGDVSQIYGSDGTKVWTVGTLGERNDRAKLISGSGAAVTLTTQQSGSTVLFDRAAGIIYTLPPPQVGLYYDFMTTVTITSNAATVITDAGTTFVLGSVSNQVAAGTSTFFQANGTSHVKIQSNGTTSGGILGGSYRMTCVSATIWLISGTIMGSGTIVTPFA